MRVVGLIIQNCKSYRERETLRLDERSTILVGPNAGGKSNTLDILTIVLRRFFLPSYTVSDGYDAGLLWQDVNQQPLFHDISKFLDRNVDSAEDDQAIQITLRVGANDLHNIRSILNLRTDLEAVAKQYRNTPFPSLSMLDSWDLARLKEGMEISFVIRDHDIVDEPADDGPLFRSYLQSLNYFILLGRDVENFDIRPTLLYFSPYRAASLQDLQANLSSDRFFDLLHEYFNATSRTSTSLIKLATVYFAEKMRRLEVSAKDRGWADLWATDEEVVLVTKYMKRLGYEWRLAVVDPRKNIYEITVRRDGREFSIARASSGEKEILNFLFGVFALRIRDGLLLVDEPELHLHPRWQGLLRDLFAELSIATGNQFFISTHSPAFVTPQTVENIRRVARDDRGSTRAVGLTGLPLSDKRALLHIINSHNNERMFFSDRVVLVEGIHDRLVFQRLVDLMRSIEKITDVVEVIEVFGKGNFERYAEFLNALKIPTIRVGDLDYLCSLSGLGVDDLFEVGWKPIERDVLKSKKSKDRETLARLLEYAIQEGQVDRLKDFWAYVKGRYMRLRSDLGDAEQERLENAVLELRSRKIYVLTKGEIEKYLPPRYRRLEDTVDLLKPENLITWVETLETNEELQELISITARIMELSVPDYTACRSSAVRELRSEIERQVVAKDQESYRPRQH
jgi:putative ATP-dependent endonuclease of the OLD family